MIKRGWLVLTECPGMTPLEAPTEIVPGVWASRGWPDPEFALPAHWNTWLGSVRADQIRRPRMVVWRDRPAPSSVNDRVNQALVTDLNLIFHSMAFVLRRGALNGFRLVELVGAGERAIQDFGEVDRLLADAFERMPKIDLEAWPAVLAGLLELNSTPATTVAAPQSLQAFVRACQATQADLRLSEFVRSMEVMFQTRPGQGAEQFARALCMFRQRPAGDSRMELYKRLYERRNGIVHGHVFMSEEHDEGFIRLSEALAREVAAAFLSDADFRRQVLSHHQHEAQWRADQRARRRGRP